IKHRDEYSKEGKANKLLEEDKSVASRRSMEQISEGKGRGPTPFMTRGSRRDKESAKADRVWDSSKGDAAAKRAELRNT
ncbi:hypothetical protein, partial [Enterobacter hormaechei]|uniref:hypothetical protein n=1 Tax=Enterobacter hormaechei TaxID=158836 RepID=UPI0013D38D71